MPPCYFRCHAFFAIAAIADIDITPGTADAICAMILITDALPDTPLRQRQRRHAFARLISSAPLRLSSLRAIITPCRWLDAHYFAIDYAMPPR